MTAINDDDDQKECLTKGKGDLTKTVGVSIYASVCACVSLAF